MPSPSPSDLELVRGLRARDPKSLTLVYGDYHAAVYNLCARILGDREEAKDVTQDVFLKAFSTPPAATESVCLKPWLYRVATNACLNLIRGRRTGSSVEPETMAAKGDPFEQAQTAALIERSLAGMNERYRAALVLKDLHGLGGRELAEVLEVSRPAADVLVHRARASFRGIFAGLAGKDAAAPANLAVVLPVLAVPAALQAIPMLPAHAPGPLGAPAPGLAPIAVAPVAGAAPAAGLIGKVAATLSAKAVLIAAGAAVVAGGGVAAVELTGNGVAPAPASTGVVSTRVGHSDQAGHYSDYGAGGWSEHRRIIALHLSEAHHDANARHHAAGSHDTAHGGDGSGSHHAAGSEHATSGSQDSTTHESATTSAGSAGTSPGTTTHDGSDAGHDGDGDGEH